MNTDKNTYDISLVYKTSVPGESFVKTISIVVSNVNEYWMIVSIK